MKDPRAGKTIPSAFAVGKKVLVKGHTKEGLRTIAAHYADIEGGVRLDESIDGIFRSWNIDALIPEEEHIYTEKFRRIQREYTAVCEEGTEFFMKLVRAAKTIEELQDLKDRCPLYDVQLTIFHRIWALERKDQAARSFLPPRA